MFSLQPRDELVFGAPSYSPPDRILDHLIADHAFTESNIINFTTTTTTSNGSRPQQQPPGAQTGLRQRQTRHGNGHGDRRVSHRDIERKRRQDMSNLHASLRQLLPRDLIKGKRSMCDHMQQAVDYIKLMKNNIEQLRVRREKLKKHRDLSGYRSGGSSDSGDEFPNLVTVNFDGHGLEILISCSIKITDFGLSKVLAELLEREIVVVSCVSTRTKGRFLHKIQAEARDAKTLNLSMLQDRLRHVIN